MIQPAADPPASSSPSGAAASLAAAPRSRRLDRDPIRLLLVEDDPSDALLIEESIRLASAGPRFRCERVARLADAVARLRDHQADVALVDLNLPDSRGLDTATRLLAEVPDATVVVMTGLEDEELATQAMQRGAQDFLVKGRFTGEVLVRTIAHAVERRSMLFRLERAAAEARANEGNLRNVISRSGEGLVVLARDRGVRFANRAAEALFGRPAAALADAFPWAEAVPGRAREVTVTRPDGAVVPAEVRVAELEWQGAPALLVSFQDLTDRKRGERVRLVRQVQRAFQPERSDTEVGGLRMAALNELCEDASGDYYDFLTLPGGRVGFVVGDVSGHGLEAALVMAQGRAGLRALCRTVSNLPRAVEHLNESLAGDLTHGRFMTLFVAAVEPRSGVTEWVNAGHQPALICRAEGGRVDSLPATGLVLGVDPDARYPAGAPATLEEGDVLFAYSDGATEAASPDGVRFGVDRLVASLVRHAKEPPVALIEAVRGDLLAWTGDRPLGDDLTLVALFRPPSPFPAPPVSLTRPAVPD